MPRTAPKPVTRHMVMRECFPAQAASAPGERGLLDGDAGGLLASLWPRLRPVLEYVVDAIVDKYVLTPKDPDGARR